jgi:NAD(P) transhydrogenase
MISCDLLVIGSGPAGKRAAIQAAKRGKDVYVIGTDPYRPEDIPFDDAGIIDSDDVLKLKQVPKSMTIIGAGVFGVEYATIFSALDVKITLVEPRNSMLDFIDRELVVDFMHQMRNFGVSMRFGQRGKSVGFEETGSVGELENDRLIYSEVTMFAAGRIGNTESLKLENCGLEVDSRCR